MRALGRKTGLSFDPLPPPRVSKNLPGAHSFAFCANEWEYRDTVEALLRVGRIPLIAKNAMSGAPSARHLLIADN